MNSYEIIAEAVRAFWKKNFPQDVIAFFYQKYDFETNWEWCEELIEAEGDSDYSNMTFLYDFCEGQTCVKDVTIVPLREVTAYYATNKKLWDGNEQLCDN